MELGLPEINHGLMDSFLSAPTDSIGARSATNDGAAPTLPSMEYTESQSAGQPGAEPANPEETFIAEQKHVEERDHDQEEEEAMRARRAFVASTIANEFGTFDDDGGHTQPAYAQPESDVPMPMEPMANLNIPIPIEAQIGKSISTKANIYLE